MMWFISHLSNGTIETIINILLFVGAAGSIATVVAINTILRLVPMFSHYYRLAQVVFIVIFMAGIYLSGAYRTEQSWRAKVQEVQAALKIAEARSAQTNTIIQEKIVTQTKIVREKTAAAESTIKERVAVHDKECVLHSDVIAAHNEAIRLLSEVQ